MKIIKFSAPWCGACQMMKPTWDEVKENNPNITFEEVDVDTDQETANIYKVSSLPTIKIFKDDEEVDTFSGAMTKDQLQEFISRNI